MRFIMAKKKNKIKIWQKVFVYAMLIAMVASLFTVAISVLAS